jgi:hypothetical protein
MLATNSLRARGNLYQYDPKILKENSLNKTTGKEVICMIIK